MAEVEETMGAVERADVVTENRALAIRRMFHRIDSINANMLYALFLESRRNRILTCINMAQFR